MYLASVGLAIQWPITGKLVPCGWLRGHYPTCDTAASSIGEASCTAIDSKAISRPKGPLHALAMYRY